MKLLVFTILFACCLTGCDTITQGTPFESVEHIEKRKHKTPWLFDSRFKTGALVKYKLDGRIGIITCVAPGFGMTDECIIRVAINPDTIISKDTAAGSGILGEVKHFPPSLYTEMIVSYSAIEFIEE